MNSTEIFTLALGLKSPWEIKDVELLTRDDSVKELPIYLGFKRGAKFEDEEGVSCPVHDTQAKTWRHLNFFEHTCLLHCSVPRIRTSQGKVRLVEVPWARKGSGFTLRSKNLAGASYSTDLEQTLNIFF